MSKYVIDDDFLYKYVKSAENIMLDNLPKEEELFHNFSKKFQKKMNKLIQQQNRPSLMKSLTNYRKKLQLYF